MKSDEKFVYIVWLHVNVIMILLDAVTCGGLAFMLAIALRQGLDSGFWIAFSIIALVLCVCIWITLETWVCAKIDRTGIEVKTYRTISKCNVADVKSTELRTDGKGVRYMVVHPKTSIVQYNRLTRKFVKPKVNNISLLLTKKVMDKIKDYMPEEIISWAYN